MMNILTESEHYRIFNEYENVIMEIKKSHKKIQIGDFYGNPQRKLFTLLLHNHPVIQRVGMDLDDASNGLFLRIPTDGISVMSRHRGYHLTYNEFVKT